MKKWSVHLVTDDEYVGELLPETAKASMFDKENQRIETLEYSDEAIGLLYKLMGESVQPRTDFIMENVDFSLVRE